MLLISIPTPCHEKWDKMTPNEQGAFCTVCSKTVIDFTSKSEEEVKKYFFQNRQKSTCGRFRNTQLSEAENLLPQLLAGSIPFWKKFLAILLILFGSFLSGCNSELLVDLKEKKWLRESEVQKRDLEGMTTGGFIVELDNGPDTSFAEIYGEMHVKGTVTVIVPENPRNLPIEINPLEEMHDTNRIHPSENVESDSIKTKVLDENGNEIPQSDSTTLKHLNP